MTYEATLALAADYLRKHTVPEERFGLAHTIGNSDWMLLVDCLVFNRMQLVLAYSGEYNDCESISARLYQDMDSHHPGLMPRMTTGYENGMHNWVQIRDEESGRIVQIDCTPWYARLDPGHGGVERDYLPLPPMVPLMFTPFSVRKIGDGKFISVYLGGFLPRCKSDEAGPGRFVVTSDGKPAVAYEDGPVYSFLFSVQKQRGFAALAEQSVNVFVSILNTAKLRVLLKSGGAMDDLIANRAVKIGFRIDLDDGNATFVPFPSMATLRRAAGQSREKDLFAEFDRLVPAVLKLLSGVHASLGIAGSDERDLNAVNGGIARADGRVSSLRAETNARYRDYIRLVDAKPLKQPRKATMRTR